MGYRLRGRGGGYDSERHVGVVGPGADLLKFAVPVPPAVPPPHSNLNSPSNSARPPTRKIGESELTWVQENAETCWPRTGNTKIHVNARKANLCIVKNISRGIAIVREFAIMKDYCAMSVKLLVSIFSTGLFAQTAQVGGRITDASGGAVHGVQVSVRSTNTGTERQVRTNDSGLYTVPLLQPGSYDVQVRQQGFKPISQRGITLEVDQRAELNFRLEVGAVTERVEVRASLSRLNTVEASQGQVIDNQRIVEMPLNGRNYIDLALMSGGAVQAAPGSRIGGFSAGGQRVSQNNYIMDGSITTPWNWRRRGGARKWCSHQLMRLRSSKCRPTPIRRSSGAGWAAWLT